MGGYLQAIVIILLASCLEVTVASKYCTDYNCSDRAGYAVALGAVSIVVTLLMVIYIQVKSSIPQQWLKVIAILLAIWWLVGVWVLTFKGCANNGNWYRLGFYNPSN